MKTTFEIFKIMEYYIAQKVKEAWGEKTCDHPHIEREYYSGAFLTNYICVQCGKEFTIAQKLEIDEERKLFIRDLP